MRMVNAIAPVPLAPVRARTKVWRAAKSAAPLFGAAALGYAGYKLSADFREVVDSVRLQINRYPRASAYGSSALTFGAIPDFLAQRYEGGKLNWRRLIGLTALGSLVGGAYCRGLYDAQEQLFPGSGLSATVKKVLFDQGTATPLYLLLYLMSVNLINKKPVFDGLREKYVGILPKGWLYWGLMALPLLYNAPQDLKVFVAQAFSLLWFTIQSKIANSSGSSEPAKPCP